MPFKTKLKDNKLHMKPKLSFAKSRNSGDGFDAMDSKKNENGAERNKRVNTRESSGDNVGYVDSFKSSGRKSNGSTGDERKDHRNAGFRSSSGKRSGNVRTMDERKERNEGFRSSSGKRSEKLRNMDELNERNDVFGSNNGKSGVKSRTKDYGRKEDENNGNEGFKSRYSGKKRKIDYGDRSSGNGDKPNWDSLLKVAGNKIKEYVGTRKQIFKPKFQNSEECGVGSEMGEGMKNSRGLRKIKSTDKMEDAETRGILKRPERRKQLDQNKSERVEVLKRSIKKKVQGKKSIANNVEEVDQKPKKKKRGIRLDPNDGSNKRINDGLPTNDGEEKKKDVQKTSNAELSMNAQFRAICPSSSILSFVEENLLGRRREIEIKRAGYNIELPSPLDNIPFSTSTERERIEEPAFRNKLDFFAAAKVSSSFPPPDLPEIAFAGRSNVGKSSLLNSLTRQWGVVRTSDKPGLTQTINFFKLEPKLCLVDLPGYGFAYAKDEVKEAWEELVKEYVSDRVGLKRVCLLVDTKWGMKPRDYDLVDLMERYQTKYQIVLTKTDLVFPIDVARRAMQIEESLKQKRSAVQPVMMVSSKSGAGIGSLRTALAKIARFVKP